MMTHSSQLTPIPRFPTARTRRRHCPPHRSTRADIADRKKGIGFSGTGFTPDNKATVTVVGTDGSKYSPETKLTVDEKGKVSGTYFFSVTDNAKVPSGNYSLYLTDEKTEKDSSKVSFEVVASAKDHR